MKKTILVIGGTGLLGQPVACHLSEADFQVRVVTRDQEKAQRTFDSSFEILAGDPTDASFLDEALDGCYGVHISLPPEVELLVVETVAKLAPGHGVQRISYISGATVAEENRWFPMIDRKFLAEKAIQETGIAYAIFCPTWVMEILPRFVNQGRAAVLGKQPWAYHWVAAEDVARMVSAAYGLEEAANQRIIILGPEVISMHEALRRYCAAFHPDIKQVSTMPFGLVKILAAVTGNRDLKFAGEMMSYFEKVGEGSHLPEVNSVLGTPTMTLDSWLQKRKSTARGDMS